jgi:hypothetical protein
LYDRGTDRAQECAADTPVAAASDDDQLSGFVKLNESFGR